MERRQLRVLLVEDSGDDAALIESRLREGPWRIEVVIAGDEATFRRRLEEWWDLVIADYVLPDFNAPAALELVRARDPDLPVVVVSGCIGEAAAVAIMRAGAADCVMKQQLSRLLPAVERELQQAAERRARRAAEQELYRLAFYHDLTALPNRRKFLQQLGGDDVPGAVFCLAFDRVHLVADALGAEASDALIQAIAWRLGAHLPAETRLAHIAYDEFAFALPAGEGAGWGEQARALREEFQQPLTAGGREIFVTPWVGVAVSGRAAAPEVLLRNARAALQRSRSDRRTWTLFGSELQDQSLERLHICDRLRYAIERGDFELHYQPKIDLARGTVAGLEALLRWRDERLGAVSPARFIPLAEESGEIIAIGEWVLRAACAQACRWREQGVPLVPIAVNVSARQLLEPGLAALIGETLEQAGLPPELLEVEVTESAIMADPQVAARNLAQLRRLGVAIAVDDFGTGYSSLGYLRRLPISTLKVDRSFINDAVEDGDSRAIVEAVVALARSLRLSVVAEGVETAAHVELLADLGCAQGQGYLFSRPIPAPEAGEFLRRHGVGGRPLALSEARCRTAAR